MALLSLSFSLVFVLSGAVAQEEKEKRDNKKTKKETECVCTHIGIHDNTQTIQNAFFHGSYPKCVSSNGGPFVRVYSRKATTKHIIASKKQ